MEDNGVLQLFFFFFLRWKKDGFFFFFDLENFQVFAEFAKGGDFEYDGYRFLSFFGGKKIFFFDSKLAKIWIISKFSSNFRRNKL